MCQGGPDGKFYSFLFIKNESKSIGKDIPQYTEDDQERVAEKYAGDILARGLTFGDIYQRRQVAILVPLEEYVLKKPFHDRFVVIGDAYHKVFIPNCDTAVNHAHTDLSGESPDRGWW